MNSTSSFIFRSFDLVRMATVSDIVESSPERFSINWVSEERRGMNPVLQTDLFQFILKKHGKKSNFHMKRKYNSWFFLSFYEGIMYFFLLLNLWYEGNYNFTIMDYFTCHCICNLLPIFIGRFYPLLEYWNYLTVHGKS